MSGLAGCILIQLSMFRAWVRLRFNLWQIKAPAGKYVSLENVYIEILNIFYPSPPRWLPSLNHVNWRQKGVDFKIDFLCITPLIKIHANRFSISLRYSRHDRCELLEVARAVAGRVAYQHVVGAKGVSLSKSSPYGTGWRMTRVCTERIRLTEKFRNMLDI